MKFLIRFVVKVISTDHSECSIYYFTYTQKSPNEGSTGDKYGQSRECTSGNDTHHDIDMNIQLNCPLPYTEILRLQK
jgi:hypothetical protein